MPAEIDLTKQQIAVLRRVMARYADRIETVAIYGSRAQGQAERGSDVDIVIYGEIDPDIVQQICDDLAESDLSIFADVTGYNDIRYPPLKAQIDKHALSLFSKSDLLVGAKIA